MIIYQKEDSLILAIFIIIISVQLHLYFTRRIPFHIICPRCISDNVIEYDDHIECLNCGLNFSSDSLNGNIDIDNIVAEEEFNEFFSAFDNEDRKKLFKIFKDEDES